MRRKNHCEIVCVLDRSGSMESIRTDAIGSFNQFLKSQKALPGTADLTLVLFDDEYQVIHDKVDLQSIPELDGKTYVPRNSTALLDAVGKTINLIGARLANTKEEDRPEKVIFTILTDGYENSSHEFKKSNIKEMIERQKDKYNWEFIFLAANQDAFAEGTSYGINMASCYTYTADATGLSGCMNFYNTSLTSSRLQVDSTVMNS